MPSSTAKAWISYTVPSHQKILIDLAGDAGLLNTIDWNGNAQQHLVDATGTILVSSGGYYLNSKPGAAQMKTLNKLITAKLVQPEQIDVY